MKSYGKSMLAAGVVLAAGALILAVATHREAPASSKVEPLLSPEGTLSSRSRIEMEKAMARWRGLADPAIPTDQRIGMARTIKPGLSPDDVAALFELMKHQPDDVRGDGWWIVLNEVMEQMRKNGVGADQYTERLSGLAKDSSAGEVPRDYAIQHLGQWLAPAVPSASPGETDNLKRVEGLQAIVSAIKDPAALNSTVPGTGLLTLADVSGRLDPALLPPLWDSLSDFVSSVIDGRLPAPPSVRGSAIQFAARTGRREQYPAIRSLAEKGGTDASTRLSSIHALGLYAEPSDKELLKTIAATDASFQYAARAALQQIEAPSGH